MLDLAVEYIKDLQKQVQVYDQAKTWKFTEPYENVYLDLKPFALHFAFLFFLFGGLGLGTRHFQIIVPSVRVQTESSNN